MSNVPNLRFKEFSGEWNFIEIGDAFKELSAGSTPSKNISNYFRGDIPWLTSGELKQKYIYETIEYITEEAVKSANLKVYDPGTLFIAITGLEAPGTRGSCAINRVKLTTNQSCMAFKKNDIVDVEFLYYWYQLFGEYIGIKYTQGTKQQSLNNSLVSKLKLAIPSREEQEKIASFFSLIDKKIELQTEKVEELKNYKKGIMQKIFSQELRFKDENGNEYPEWEEKKLGRICEVKKGEQLNKEFLLPHGKYYALNGGVEPSGFTDKYNTEQGVISISEGGNSCGYVKYNTEKFWSGGHCYTLENTLDYIDRKYLFQILKFNESKIMSLRVGSGLPNIQKSAISNFVIYMPDYKEQVQIANLLYLIDMKIIKEEEKLRLLNQYKKGLLQQMFI